MAITATCDQVPDSRTNRGSAWRAIAIVDGVAYSATSRSSAVGALCRELVAGGVPDDAIQITFDGVAGEMRIKSIYRFSGTTLAEGDAPIHRVKWRPYQGPQNAEPVAAGEAGMGLAMPAALPGPPDGTRVCRGLSAKCDMRRLRPAFRAQAIGCQDMRAGLQEAGKPAAGGMTPCSHLDRKIARPKLRVSWKKEEPRL